MTIDSRFHDLGFGSKEVDLTSTPNNTNLLSYSNNGFGNLENITLNNTIYKNTREFNFGSDVKVSIQQEYNSVKYEEITEKGSIKIKKNNFSILNIKNNLIKNANLILMPRKFSLKRDISVYFEKNTNRSFKIFNNSNKDTIVDYIATRSNRKLTNINSTTNANTTKLNNKIDLSLQITQTIIALYDESTLLDKKIDTLNNVPDDSYVQNLTLGVNHTLQILNSNSSAIYLLDSLNKDENSYFKFNTPDNLQNNTITIKESNITQVKVYKLNNTDDISTRVLQSLGNNEYGIVLESSTSYYFWYYPILSSWMISTDRFPNQTIYS